MACAKIAGRAPQQGDDEEVKFEVQEEEVWEQEGGKPRPDNGTIADEQQRQMEQQLLEFIRHQVSFTK